MKILLTNYHGFEEGGAQKSTYLLAKFLEESGQEVLISSTKNYPKLKTEVFKKFLLPEVFFQKKNLVPFLKKIIAKNSIEIVCAQDRLTSFAGAIASNESGISSSVVFRDYWFACTKSTCLKPNMENCTCSLSDIAQSNPFYRVPWEFYKINSIRRNLHLFENSKKIAVSVAVKNKLLQSNVNGPISVIPNIVEFNEPKNFVDIRKKFGFRGKIVFFAARFTYEKGIFHLIEAAKKVLMERSEVYFLLAGSGPLKQKAIELVAQFGLSEKILFSENVPFEEIGDYYSQSDIIVVPSFMESFGRTAIEGFAAKKPVIASKIGGLTDIIEDGVNGFLIEPKNANLWAEKILKLLDDAALSKRLGENGYKKAVKKYSGKVVVKKLLEEFEI